MFKLPITDTYVKDTQWIDEKQYKNYIFKLFVNDFITKEWPGNLAGLALLAFNSLSLCEDYKVVLQKYFVGEESKFDPVLHKKTEIVAKSNPNTPCPKNPNECVYRKSQEKEFISATRPTTLRIEIIQPCDHCGFLLKPEHSGGSFFDYGYCIPIKK